MSCSAQPEAIAFYAARGYTEIPGFGVYRDAPGSICFARELRPGGHGVRDAGR